jgi:flagellar protein FliS
VAETNPAGVAANTYQQHDIETADPLSLIVRVFNLGSLHVARARAALASGDIAAKGRAVHHVSRCLTLLQGTLKMDEGGEVARNLDRLYTYLNLRLSEAHINNDDDAFAEIAGHLTELGAAWRQAAAAQGSPAQPEAAASAAPATVTP